MHFSIRFVRKYPLSLLCILLIWALSLTPFFPETPFDDVQFIDIFIAVIEEIVILYKSSINAKFFGRFYLVSDIIEFVDKSSEKVIYLFSVKEKHIAYISFEKYEILLLFL